MNIFDTEKTCVELSCDECNERYERLTQALKVAEKELNLIKYITEGSTAANSLRPIRKIATTTLAEIARLRGETV